MVFARQYSSACGIETASGKLYASEGPQLLGPAPATPQVEKVGSLKRAAAGIGQRSPRATELQERCPGAVGALLLECRPNGLRGITVSQIWPKVGSKLGG
mmetsp:Transcript_120395/g.269111  ORF Transcript_120395/g.269111 Transcript_120395/m.269111 type:complete len:100 (+) Transcript_120395:2-301(+)